MDALRRSLLGTAILPAVLAALAGCGGGSSTSAVGGQGPRPASTAGDRGGSSVRYRPGDPGCRADRAPGTVSKIGEDVIGSPVRGFVACYGPSLGEEVMHQKRCLDYRERGARAGYWRFCVSDGRIVSGRGDLPRPAPR